MDHSHWPEPSFFSSSSFPSPLEGQYLSQYNVTKRNPSRLIKRGMQRLVTLTFHNNCVVAWSRKIGWSFYDPRRIESLIYGSCPCLSALALFFSGEKVFILVQDWFWKWFLLTCLRPSREKPTRYQTPFGPFFRNRLNREQHKREKEDHLPYKGSSWTGALFQCSHSNFKGSCQVETNSLSRSARFIQDLFFSFFLLFYSPLKLCF